MTYRSGSIWQRLLFYGSGYLSFLWISLCGLTPGIVCRLNGSAGNSLYLNFRSVPGKNLAPLHNTPLLLIPVIATMMIMTVKPVTAQEVIEVHPGQSIGEAVDRACSNDTILIHAGHYTEHQIIVRRPLNIIGRGRPVIDADRRGDIFLIAAKDVLFKGLQLQHTGVSNLNDYAGIKVYDSYNLRVEDVVFEHTFFGIHISNSENIYIGDCTLRSYETQSQRTANGIHLWKCSHALIENNYVYGHRDGIYLEFVTDAETNGNVVEYNNRYGLHFMFSHDNAYYRNEFRHNGAGVAVMYTRNVIMKYNLFEDNQGTGAYAILLKDINDSEMRYNRIVNNTIGIYMEGSNRNVIEHNLFRNNGWAIKLLASNDANKLLSNNFTGNTFDISTNSRQVTNTLKMNYWDKYEGYDLDRDGYGDVPYHPINLYSTIVERIPAAIILWRSFMVTLLDRAERVMPVITPVIMRDDKPKMRPHDIDFKPQ